MTIRRRTVEHPAVEALGGEVRPAYVLDGLERARPEGGLLGDMFQCVRGHGLPDFAAEIGASRLAQVGA
jgi:hypothetical protein